MFSIVPHRLPYKLRGNSPPPGLKDLHNRFKKGKVTCSILVSSCSIVVVYNVSAQMGLIVIAKLAYHIFKFTGRFNE